MDREINEEVLKIINSVIAIQAEPESKRLFKIMLEQMLISMYDHGNGD